MSEFVTVCKLYLRIKIREVVVKEKILVDSVICTEKIGRCLEGKLLQSQDLRVG